MSENSGEDPAIPENGRENAENNRALERGEKGTIGGKRSKGGKRGKESKNGSTPHNKSPLKRGDSNQFLSRLKKLFNMRETTWSSKLDRAYGRAEKQRPLCEKDVSLVEQWYNLPERREAEIPDEFKDVLSWRRTLSSLLNNWGEDVPAIERDIRRYKQEKSPFWH